MLENIPQKEMVPFVKRQLKKGYTAVHLANLTLGKDTQRLAYLIGISVKPTDTKLKLWLKIVKKLEEVDINESSRI